MSNEKILAKAVVESITHCTGRAPRRSQSIVPQLAAWLLASVAVVGILVLLTKAAAT